MPGKGKFARCVETARSMLRLQSDVEILHLPSVDGRYSTHALVTTGPNKGSVIIRKGEFPPVDPYLLAFILTGNPWPEKAFPNGLPMAEPVEVIDAG